MESSNDFSRRILVDQFTFQGDPALRLNTAPGPDYIVDGESVQFIPEVVNAQMDDFQIQFDIQNLGFYRPDSMVVTITQVFPNGSEQVQVKDTVTTTPNIKTLNFTIPIEDRSIVGQNRFLISIDTEDQIEELPAPEAELNNALRQGLGQEGVNLFIIDNTAIPVFPYDYSIVNTPSVTLKASTVDVLAAEQTYIIELDTTEQFNSPQKRSVNLARTGGLIEWNLQSALQDSMVYYWRISPDSTNTGRGFVWNTSSFIYLPNNPSDGWNQSDHYQFLDNDFEAMRLGADRQFKFPERYREIRIRNFAGSQNGNEPTYFNNSTPWARMFIWQSSNINAGLQIVSIDPIKSRFVVNEFSGMHGSVNNFNGTLPQFSFRTDSVIYREQVIEFLEEVVPDDNFVIIYTGQRNQSSDFEPEEWANDEATLGKSIFSVLEEQGATQIRSLESTGSVPYILMYQKGKGLINEIIADEVGQEVNMEFPFPFHFTEGYFNSTVVGPAKNWESLSWNAVSIDSILVDSSYLNLTGIDTAGNEILLIDQFTGTEASLESISADQFPYLKLQLWSWDEPNRTPAQLEHWRINYEGYTDLAIQTNDNFSYAPDTIEQGEAYSFLYDVANVGRYDADSVLIRYQLVNQTSVIRQGSKRISPLSPDQLGSVSFDILTEDLNGEYRILVEVNPDGDQPELNSFNNFSTTSLFVQGDLENPLLDVTFDGRSILDGDLVSPVARIQISLLDENPFLRLQDTNQIKVFLQTPSGLLPEYLPFSNPALSFQPASSTGQNKAIVEYQGDFQEDGEYRLLVQANDVNGNASGDLDYTKTFEVINESSISNFLNYPNPFSTSTTFIYTLTGREVPDTYKIQIMTVSGRIVKEITAMEAGPLQLGQNQLDYNWDGTDQYGDRLAAGVYLYRIVLPQSDEGMKAYRTSADRFFKKGFGKLVILR